MKNKLLMLLLCFAMVGSCVACGTEEEPVVLSNKEKNNKEKNDKEKNKKDNTESNSEENHAQDNVVETEESAEPVDPDAWRLQYIDKVQEWQLNHGADENVAYNLLYIDDDDVPELFLSCDSVEAWYSEYIFSSYGGELVTLISAEDVWDYYISYYEGSGLFLKEYSEKSYYGRCYHKTGRVWKNGSLSDVVISADTIDYDEEGNWVNSGEGWYKNEAGEVVEVTYSGEGVTLSLFPDVDDITSTYGIEDINSPKFVGVYDSMTYDEICEALGITDKVTPCANSYYRRVLTDWMSGTSNGLIVHGSTAYYSNEAVDKRFALLDINGDGIEDLLIGSPYEVHLMKPACTWEESYCGEIYYIDGNGIVFSGCSYPYGTEWTVYEYDGKSCTEICILADEDGSDMGEDRIIYYMNGNEVTEAEYNAVFDSYNLQNISEIDYEWYEVTVENIESMF